MYSENFLVMEILIDPSNLTNHAHSEAFTEHESYLNHWQKHTISNFIRSIFIGEAYAHSDIIHQGYMLHSWTRLRAHFIDRNRDIEGW